MRLNKYFLYLLLGSVLTQNIQAVVPTPIKFGAGTFIAAYVFLKTALGNNDDFGPRESIVTASFLVTLCIFGKAATSHNSNDFKAAITGMISALIVYKKLEY